MKTMKDKALIDKIIFSFCGFRFMLRERSFRFELILCLPTLIVMFFGNNNLLNILCAIAYIQILIIECLNTCIERICDLIVDEYSIQIKKIKDVGSFAVFLAITLNVFLIIVAGFK